MGSSNSKKHPPILTHCSIPAYSIKTLGSRHFLIAGGGGSAKTGVKNEIELFLLSYNHFSKLGTPPTDGRPNSSTALWARQTQVVSTAERATMNMDVIPIASLDQGKFLVSTGQDEFCVLYETTGYKIKEEEMEVEVPSRLGLNFQELMKIKTDTSVKDPYQGPLNSYECVNFHAAAYHINKKCVRFDRSGGEKPLRMATGGSDGYIRVWNVSDILMNRDPTRTRKPMVEFLADFDSNLSDSVQDLDISVCGLYLASVAKDVNLWDMNLGRRITKLVNVPQLGDGFKVRSLRFTQLDRSGKNSVFVVAYNQRTMSSKAISYLAVWAFNKEQRQCNLYTIQQACTQSISSLSVSSCGRFTAIGTMGGSVGVYDTQHLQLLYFAKETHTNFVTAIDFLPNRTYDVKEGYLNTSELKLKNTPSCFLPGITSDQQTSVISLSVDQSIQVHSVPYPTPGLISNYIVKLAIWTLVLYVLFWLLLFY